MNIKYRNFIVTIDQPVENGVDNERERVLKGLNITENDKGILKFS